MKTKRIGIKEVDWKPKTKHFDVMVAIIHLIYIRDEKNDKI